MEVSFLIPALSIKELGRKVSEKYATEEKHIVGIMFARYGIKNIQEIISDCYLYWHLNSGADFDIFWAGYGEYLPPSQESETKTILNFSGNKTRVYFDLEAFITFKGITKKMNIIKYQDQFELVLLNVRKGKLCFEENIRINFEENIQNGYSNLRTIMEYIIEECREVDDLKDFHRKMKVKKLWEMIKGVKVSDIVSTAIGLASL